MAKIRFSHLDDFVLKDDGNVGIGTSLPSAKVEVIGTVRAANLKLTSGINTVTSIDGYMDQDMEYSDNVSINTGDSGTLSGEIVVGSGLTMTVGTGATSGQGIVESMKVSNTFTPPIGLTADRPTSPQPGALFYNKDFKTIEYWDGNFWRQVDYTTRSARAVFAGGGSPFEHPSKVPYMSGRIIDYVQIASTGNAKTFGDLTQFSRHTSGLSNHIRGIVYHGSATPGDNNVMDKITIASQGNAVQFGLIDGTDTYAKKGAASSTRGVFVGGSPGNTDIDYIEIMTDGNSKDFGDLSTARRAAQTCCDGKRVVVAGGRGVAPSNPLAISSIESFMIASKGNVSSDFGEMIARRCDGFGFSNSVRGIFGAGKDGPNIISQGTTESLIIASGGNAISFGECYTGRYTAGCASQTRGLIAGGINPGGSKVNTIHYLTIESAGSSIDFGDLTRPTYDPAGVSDSHGGLGGF